MRQGGGSVASRDASGPSLAWDSVVLALDLDAAGATLAAV
jgi:hypothetical protein